ncbi:MAG: SIR2 family protein [Hyphomicrobiaceae bacterium]
MSFTSNHRLSGAGATPTYASGSSLVTIDLAESIYGADELRKEPAASGKAQPTALCCKMTTTIHNPDRFMMDLRQVLSQGRKRIGLLIGAGTPVSVRVNAEGKIDPAGGPLIPDVAGLTNTVVAGLEPADKAVVDTLLPELGGNPNIEAILTRIRRLAQAIGAAEVHGLNGAGYDALALKICEKIGLLVSVPLPTEPSPFTELAAWIGGTHRQHPVEIFTPNYDLLIEEAFERARLPYFDGFTGAHKPFFDPTSIADDPLPSRWSRLWNIHGSLGWKIEEDTIIRTGDRTATTLIYPDHLKYDQTTRQPYSALFQRLRDFLTTPDSLLLCSGFSFADAHITAVLDEALSCNTHTAVLAFQFIRTWKKRNRQ